MNLSIVQCNKCTFENFNTLPQKGLLTDTVTMCVISTIIMVTLYVAFLMIDIIIIVILLVSDTCVRHNCGPLLVIILIFTIVLIPIMIISQLWLYSSGFSTPNVISCSSMQSS